MAPNFKELLKKPLDTIERPKPIPAGTWNGRISNWDFGESSEKKTPYLYFNVKLTSPGDDIDPGELEGTDLSKLRTMRSTYYLTEDALFRVKELLTSCGVDTTGRTIAEALPDMANAEVICSITLQPSTKNPEEFFNSIDRMKGTAEA